MNLSGSHLGHTSSASSVFTEVTRRSHWKKWNGIGASVLDWLTIMAGVGLSGAYGAITPEKRIGVYVWSAFLVLYFIWYRRLASVIYWSTSTYRLLRESTTNSIGAPSEYDSEERLTFHILIAARAASGCIAPVLRAAASQDFPNDRFHVWVITERGEREDAVRARETVLRAAQEARQVGDLEPAALSLLWRCAARDSGNLATWSERLKTGELRRLISHPASLPLLLEDLFTLLLHELEGNSSWRRALAHLGLRSSDLDLLDKNVELLRRQRARTTHDFADLLGAEIFNARDVESQLIARCSRTGSLLRLARRLQRRLAEQCSSPAVPHLAELERAIKETIVSTQDVVRETEGHLNSPNLHHLDPVNLAFKPGALNIAYREIKKLGLLRFPERTFFIIIDSDSLLPRYALSTIALELQHQEQAHSILQMVSVPTANFFSAHWYSKFIAFADAIGAVGKWARSTRRQLRPDLHAGSGVVVPATLTNFIEENEGGPWAETTITEDARLIIGQFGLMRLCSNNTGMVPVFLLEAVPEGANFLQTYLSFWRQRQRWTKGGFDEIGYMLHASSSLRYTRFDAAEKRWRAYLPSLADRIRSRLFQAYRIWLWIFDHFMWGIGGMFLLTHWWLLSFFLGQPVHLARWVGFLLLLAMPLVFLLGPGRELAHFVPGGLSTRRKIYLYLQSFVLIWLYCLPVAITQLACCLGFGPRLNQWAATEKPGARLRYASK